MKPGDGNFTVNEKKLDDYFGGLNPSSTTSIMQPLELTEASGQI